MTLYYYTNERGGQSSGSEKIFDIYLIVEQSSWNEVKNSLPYIRRNIDARKIFVVSSRKILDNDLCECEFLDEDEILEGLSFEAVKGCLSSLDAFTNNTGWYLQQFIKLGISRICKNEYYLVWDADTIPLNPIPFFDKNGRPYLNLKREYFSVYFRTIENLLGLKKNRRESFISEHMLFKTDVVKRMLDEIESSRKFSGSSFWEKILYASDLHHYDFIKDDQRFFSEFETYGTYCLHYYPGLYAVRKLRTLRHGVDFLGKNVSGEILEWASKDFDTISFEKWGTPIPEMMKLVGSAEYRSKMSFADIIRLFFRQEKRKIFENFPHVNHKQFINFFEKTISKTYFDFFFSKKLAYKKRFHVGNTNFIENHKFLYVTRCRVQRYWRLLTLRF